MYFVKCTRSEAVWFLPSEPMKRLMLLQMSRCVSVRWVSKEYEIFEEPIGLVKLTKTDAATIFAALKDVLLRCVLPVNTCRGQAYDGAAIMSGNLRGVASHFKKEEPATLMCIVLHTV